MFLPKPLEGDKAQFTKGKVTKPRFAVLNLTESALSGVLSTCNIYTPTTHFEDHETRWWKRNDLGSVFMAWGIDTRMTCRFVKISILI